MIVLSRAPRKLRLLPILLLTLAAPFAAQAAPPFSVDVDIDDMVPVFGDAFVYQNIAGDTQSSPARARLAIDLYLHNNEAFAVDIDHVTFDFDSPNITSLVLDSGLQMWCSGVPAMMTGVGNLNIPAGAQCRLGLTPDPLIALPAPGRLRISVAFQGILLAASTVEKDLTSYQNSTATGSYRFPARAEDLTPDLFWSGRPALSGSHHRFSSRTSDNEVFAYDMGVIRYDSTAGWVSYKEPDPGEPDPNDENDDFLCWEVPIYAMADGIVQSFDNNQNDHVPGPTPPGALPNHFTILHGDEVAWYGHLRKNSLNPLLMAPGSLVKEGDYLGKVGNTGSSTAPHLHIQVTRNGDPMPLHFNDSFLIERDTAFASPPYGNAPWSGIKGQGLSPSLTAVWPSGLRRRGEATDVGITDVDLTTTSSSRTVSAARTAAGNLRVSLWRTDSTGEAVLLATDTGGGVSEVALATPTSTTDAALAMITAGGSLKLIAYDVTSTGLTRTAEYNSSTAHDVIAAPAPYSKGIVTAVRTQFDNLKVIAWTVDPSGGSIIRRGEDDAGSISDMAMVRTYTFPGVVTAVRNGSDRLQLLTYRVASGGNTVQQEDSYVDASVEQVSIARLGFRDNGDDLVVTACRTLAGTLELVSWSINSAGDITRLDDQQAGVIAEVSVGRATNHHVLTSVSDAFGDLEVIAWHVADDGAFTRRAESEGGDATLIVQAGAKQTLFSDPSLAVTALADSSGDLKLIVYQVLLTD